MSTILYRDGNAEMIDPLQVDSCLKNGYFLTRELSIGEKPKKAPKKAKKTTKKVK